MTTHNNRRRRWRITVLIAGGLAVLLTWNTVSVNTETAGAAGRHIGDLQVVRVDLLGHGRSAKPADGYGIAEQARRIVAVLDHLGVRRATVVGHSTGGAVVTSP